MTYTIILYQAATKEWRYEILSDNGVEYSNWETTMRKAMAQATHAIAHNFYRIGQ